MNPVVVSLVRGTADTECGAYSPSGQSSSYSLTTLSSPSSTDRRAETDRMFITTRIAVAHHFSCRLRRKESCILGATSSQPTLPLHELPPARLVIHRQTSAHERRKWTLSVQLSSGMLVHLCPRQHWLWVTVEPHIPARATRRLLLGRGVATSLYAEFWARNH